VSGRVAGAATGAAAAVVVTSPPPADAVQPGLLPEAQALSGATLNDAMSALYAELSRQRQLGMKAGESRVVEQQNLHEKAVADQKAAIEEQRRNEADQGDGFFSCVGRLVGDVAKDVATGRLASAVDDGVRDAKNAVDSPAFWSDLEKGATAVAKVAAVVGSVALTVATAGAGSAAIVGVALLLSAGGAAVSATRCLDGVLGKGASQYVGAGMELAGAATGCTAGLASAGGAVGAAASGVAGGAQITAGAAHVRNAEFAARVQDAGASAEHARQQGERINRVVGWMLDELADGDKTQQRTMQAAQTAMQTNDQTTVSAASISLRG
jgi:hypothetical protein